MSGLEKLDRRLFLRGLTLTSAGLVVPRSIISVPKQVVAERCLVEGAAWTGCGVGRIVAAYEWRVEIGWSGRRLPGAWHLVGGTGPAVILSGGERLAR